MGKTAVPQYHALTNPLLQALKALGGSGTNEETENKVLRLDGGESPPACLLSPLYSGRFVVLTTGPTLWEDSSSMLRLIHQDLHQSAYRNNAAQPAHAADAEQLRGR